MFDCFYFFYYFFFSEGQSDVAFRLFFQTTGFLLLLPVFLLLDYDSINTFSFKEVILLRVKLHVYVKV